MNSLSVFGWSEWFADESSMWELAGSEHGRLTKVRGNALRQTFRSAIYGAITASLILSALPSAVLASSSGRDFLAPPGLSTYSGGTSELMPKATFATDDYRLELYDALQWLRTGVDHDIHRPKLASVYSALQALQQFPLLVIPASTGTDPEGNIYFRFVTRTKTTYLTFENHTTDLLVVARGMPLKRHDHIQMPVGTLPSRISRILAKINRNA